MTTDNKTLADECNCPNGRAEHLPTCASLRATLADVQPGGRVRLGDGPWPEIDAILADAYSAGAEGLPFEGIARRAAVRKAVAALSAQPSPGGQGDCLRHSPEDYRDARMILARNMKRVAEKYNVPDLAADADVVRSGEEYDFWMDAAHEAVREALAARQPVGQDDQEYLESLDRALEGVIDQRDRYHEIADDLAGHIAAITGVDIGEHSSANCPWQNAIEAAEVYRPAQAVDLPNVIDQIAQQWDGCNYDAVGETIDVGQAIRAAGKRLINGKAVGNG
ncbi:hypothetical protein [Stenotrophomonas maltophilia]|uniref:hypothetical protein n=1 Tax=Stenotrophomonas maltophilia TaxID=40324 RepID=UPI000517D0C2|nr:hypothetical protein [Stenotrophomonas maltophilia]KWV45044.1 hypothetical protein AS591_20260 [Stenotrophomonas maltophilia]MBA0459198.1 hypothetical protein [Stenotrophomonas maltophilia]